MSRSFLVMLGMVVGSFIGGYVPSIFGVSNFSVTSIMFNALGGFAGIWISYKLTQDL